MVSDVIKINMQIKNEYLLREEKTDLIIQNLKSLIDRLEETKGDIQQMKANDEDSSLEYVHLKQSQVTRGYR